MKKRIVSLLLVAIMLFALMPSMSFNANAEMNTTYRNSQRYEYAIFPIGGAFHVTQKWFAAGDSHANQIAMDFLPLTSAGGVDYNRQISAPFTGKIVNTYPSWGCVVFQSNNPVQYADGTVDYMTVVFGHDNNSENYTKNVTIEQGEPLCKPGTAGGYAYHSHIFVVRGTWANWCNGGYKQANQTYVNSGGGNVIPTDAFVFDSNFSDDWTQTNKSCYYPMNKVVWTYLDNVTNYAAVEECVETINTNICVQVSPKEGAKLWTLPCDNTTNTKSINKYTVPYNTTFNVTKIIKNTKNNYWYEVKYKGEPYYLFSKNTSLYSYTTDLSISSPRLPSSIEAGSKFSIGGIISSKGGGVGITNITAKIYNAAGAVVDQSSVNLNSVNSYDISWPSPIDADLEFNRLPAGPNAANKDAKYSLSISAAYSVPYAYAKELRYKSATCSIIKDSGFTVVGITKTCNIAFDPNGADTKISSVEILEGGTLEVLPSLTREYFTFLGWYTAKTGGTKVTTNTAFSSDTTLYARWKGKTYTVDVSYNGGKSSDGSSFNTKNYTLGEPIGSLPTVTRPGYSFRGWFASGPDTMITESSIPTKPIISITAFWEKTRYEVDGGYIYFDTSTGTLTGADTTVTSAVIPPEIEGVSVKYIAAEAFSYCQELNSIFIPDSVIKIGDKAFYFCQELNSISIPDSVIEIGDKAFYNCSSLQFVSFGSEITDINADMFKQCNSLEAFSISVNNSVYSSVGNSIYSKDGSILIYALADSEASYNIPANVSAITEDAFTFCDNLVSITVDKENDRYTSIDGILYSKDQLELIKCPAGKDGSVIVPETVISVSANAFYGCETITEILLPPMLQTIGEGAFSRCGIKKIVLPDSLHTIPDNAFSGCQHLSDVTIPNSIETIGDRAFASCPLLVYIVLPESVTYFGDRAFTDARDYCLNVYLLGDAPQTSSKTADCRNIHFHITAEAYSKVNADSCSYYHSFVDPNSEDSFIIYPSYYVWFESGYAHVAFDVLSGTFLYVFTHATSFTIPSTFHGVTVRGIGDHAFGIGGYDQIDLGACDNLKVVDLPYSIEHIGNWAFSGCEKLEQINLPYHMESIGEGAFSDCDSLRHIVLPYGITEIPAHTFEESGLICIDSQDTITSIGNYAFFNCTALKDVRVLDGVREIGDYAFAGASWIEFLSLPATLESLGEMVFYHTNPYITVEEGNRSFISENGVLYNGDCSSLICYPQNSKLKQFEIPDTVATIEEGAFWGSGISELTMHISVKEIKDYAIGSSGFAAIIYDGTKSQWDKIKVGDCNEGLLDTSIIFKDYTFDTDAYICGAGDCGDGVHWALFSDSTLYIYGNGRRMYDYETSLDSPLYCDLEIKHVVVQDGITHIGDYAFPDNRTLESVSLPDTLTSIGKGAFLSCKYLKSINLNDNIESIGESAFYGCKSLESIHLPEKLTQIENFLFYFCENLKNINIPDNVTSIGSLTFCGCSKLEAMELPMGITSIGRNAFESSGIEEITIPNGVTIISTGLFKNCEHLEKVVLGKKIEKVGDEAFYNTAITALSLPSIKQIGKNAFGSCELLHILDLGGAIENIATNFLSGSDAVCDIYFDGSIAKWKSFDIQARTAIIHCNNGNVEPVGIAHDTFYYDNEDAEWRLLKDGTLIISGTGPADFYNSWVDEDVLEKHRNEITTVIIEDGITAVSSLSNCPNLITVYVPSSCGTCPFLTNCRSLKNLILGDGVYIFYAWLDGCTSLEKLYIPAESDVWIPDIWNDEDLVKCGIKGFEVSPDNEYLCSVDGVLFSKDMKTLLLYPSGKADKEYSVPDGVEAIRNYAFSEATALTSVTIPASVTDIGSYAFFGCLNLRAAYFRGNAPYGNPSIFYADADTPLNPFTLYYYDIAEYVMEYDAEFDSYSYTEIYNVCHWWNDADWKEYKKKELHLLGPYEEHSFEAENGNIYYVPGRATITRADKTVTHAEIPQVLDGRTVEIIDSGAFANCTNLTEIILPDTVEFFSDDSFNGCTSLKKINWPNDLKGIGQRAFKGCSSLTDFSFPDNLQAIYSYAFDGCSGMKEVSFGENLQSVESYAFTNGPDLKEITLPASLKKLWMCAFDCENLKHVYFEGDSPYVEHSFPSYPIIHFRCDAEVSDGYLYDYYVTTDCDDELAYKVEATCSEKAYNVYVCKRCGREIWQYTDDAYAEHSIVEDEEIPATCESCGYTAGSYCLKCGKIVSGREVIPRLEHEYISTAVLPTCTTNGYVIHSCIYCGESFKDSVSEKTGHVWRKPTVLTEPTCSQEGVIIYECSECGQYKSETVSSDPSNHSFEQSVFSPTCTAQGYTSYTCVCGEGYVDNYVDALGHNYSFTVNTEPTTSKSGTLTGSCSRCQDTTTVTLPKLNTTDYTYKVTKDASCTAAGTASYAWKATTYGNFSFTVTLPKLDHSYSAAVTAPTCTERGYTTHTCSGCDDSYVDTYVGALGHNYSFTVNTEPTTSKSGTLAGFCSRCQDTTTVTLPKLNTTDYTYRVTKEASCTATGTASYAWKTTTYGNFSFTVTLPKLDHSYNATVTVPTCIERGYTTHTCPGCGDSYVDTYVDALGHDYGTWYKTKTPTCTENGIERHGCSRCDSLETREVKALGHDWDDGVVTKQPTEESTGIRTYTCSRCTATKTESIPELAHTHRYTATVTDPTCTERGYTTHTCKCGDSYVDNYVDALGHNYSYTVNTEPTTSKSGTLTGICSRCQDTTTVTFPKLNTTDYTYRVTKDASCTATGTASYAWKTTTYGNFSFIVTLPKLDHSYNATVTVPTCIERGYTTHTCFGCGDSYVDTYVDALGHDYGTWYKTKTPTCTENGIERHECSRCDSLETREVKALGHDWDDGVVTKQPTEESTGIRTYTCSRCTATKTESIPELAHTHRYTATVTDPTCTERGYTTHTCKCGDSYVDNYVDALGHNYSYTVNTEPTTSKSGTLTGICSRCQDTTTVTLPKLNTTDYTYNVTKGASCTSTGTASYTWKITTYSNFSFTVTLPKLGHSYAAAITKPTCTERGYMTHTCSSCGDSYVDTYVDALGHDWGSGVVTKQPTEEGTGIRYYTCSRCTATKTEIIPELAHVHSYTATVIAPTCTEKGYTTHVCRCGDSYKDAYTNALGHSYNAWYETKAPSCVEKGVERHDCSRCDNFETREIAAIGHHYTADVNNPTCTERGYTTHTCSQCGDNYKDAYTDALGHNYSYATTKTPTTGASGTLTGICNRCQGITTATLPNLNTTDYSYKVTKAATCTADGSASYMWKITTYGTYTFTVTLPAIGHSYMATVTNPTCTERGYTTHACSKCGASYVDTYVDALGHDWGGGVVTTEPTETSTGVRTFTCSRCGETKTETIPELAHTHSYTAFVTAPTCTEKGYTTHTCRCGESYKDSYTNALGHNYGAWYETKSPTCTEKGTEQHDCTRCDAFESCEVKALGHSYVNGKCTRCGAADPDYKPPLVNPFTDIASCSKSFQTAIIWASSNGIAAGTSATTYNPNGSCTRGQVVTFLWRAAGKPEPTTSNNPYNDVSSSAYYYKAILWAAENGITAGYNNADGSKSFKPGDTVTRGQFVTFLWRYLGKPAPSTTVNPFNDVNPGGFYNAILWGSENGIVAGYNNADGTMSFKPNNPCTRAHVAVFLYRAMGK